MSEETAYQMTYSSRSSKERNCKKLRSLKVPLAGKQEQQMIIMMHGLWGFLSKLVNGVYIGYDNPKTLGKFETGSKAALPIFKDFVEKALYKEDFGEFGYLRIYT